LQTAQTNQTPHQAKIATIRGCIIKDERIGVFAIADDLY
jgi:hypothetical protein